MLLAAYLDRVAAALGAKDGASLAQLLSVSKRAVPVELQTLAVAQVEQICASKLARFGPLGEVATGVVVARRQLEAGDVSAANTAQIAAVVKFMELFREQTNWIVPFLHVLTVDTRLIAAKVTGQQTARPPGCRHPLPNDLPSVYCRLTTWRRSRPVMKSTIASCVLSCC